MNPEPNYVSPHSVSTNGYNSQAQKLILNVLHFFKMAKKDSSLLLGEPLQLASRALNVNKNTFTNIEKEKLSCGKFSTPKRVRVKWIREKFDSFDINALKNIIAGFYGEG
jgi:hypothetical protein